MKKKAGKRSISLLLAGMMIFSLTACGNGGQKKSEEANQAAKEHVYSLIPIELEKQVDGFNNVFVKGEKIYAVGYSWGEGGSKDMLISCDLEGSNVQVTDLAQPMNSWTSNYTLDENGNLYAIREISGSNDEGIIAYPEDDMAVEADPEDDAEADTEDDAEADTEDDAEAEDDTEAEDDSEDVLIDDDMAYEDTYQYRRELVCWDAQGTEQWAILLGSSANEEEAIDPRGLYWSPQNQLLLMTEQKILVYDANGQQTDSMALQIENLNYNMYFAEDGTVLFTSYNNDYTKQIVSKYSLETKKVVEQSELPENFRYSNILQGLGYDVYLSNEYGLFGYNLGEESATELMNYMDSDFAGDRLNYVVGISDTQFVASYNDAIDYSAHLAIFKKVNPEDIKDKKVITLACNYLNYYVKGHVIDFNKENENYRIVIKDYSQYATEDDWEAGLTKLNTDIVSGNMPDILLVDDGIPVDSYIAKGLFADLYEFLDTDPEFKREDLLSNILEAYSVNGKWYCLVPTFSIQTVFGKTSDIGDRDTWTMDDLQAIMETKPEGTSIFAETSRNEVLSAALRTTASEYIDQETGVCSFDSEGFQKLLEFMKQFPEQVDYSAMEEGGYWESYETMYREGRTLLMLSGIYSFRDFNYTEKATFGEDITTIGFPNEGGTNGSAIMANLNMAMSSRSVNKEGAWEFMRYFLTDECQEEMYGLSILESRMKEFVEEAQKRPYTTLEDGTIEEYDDMIYVNGVEMVLEPMSKEEAEELLTFIKSVKSTSSYDESLLNIIKEEAAAYFQGQKSVQEVVNIIQSRAQVYINESR